MRTRTALASLAAAALGVVAVRDVTQREQALKRNFPVLAHARYLLEKIGPELRQYIVSANDAERPFSRDQRRWVYASAKLENNYFGFGTDNDVETRQGYPIIKQRTFVTVEAEAPEDPPDPHVLRGPKVVGAARQRPGAFLPPSAVNVSGMSFGSLSGPAIEALNEGARLADCMQNTGEGALSPHHRRGGDLVFQIGTGYFGCRDLAGRFDLPRLVDLVASAPVRMIEIKLSQGAKPGLGGMLPGAKVTPEIAEIRGIEVGKDCISPSRHTEFGDVDSMLDFVERVAQATGLPVGIKTAVGDLGFFDELAATMTRERMVDFINVDGGEGGTGAAPLVFSDSVAYPFRIGFSEVYRRMAEAGWADDVTFIGAGKLGLPENALVAFALGADMVNVGREAMLAIGCIQAQQCHTGHCPTGVATQNPWLVRGLDPASKAARLANYVATLRRDLRQVADAVGVDHPARITVDDIDLVDGVHSYRSLREVYRYPDEVRSSVR